MAPIAKACLVGAVVPDQVIRPLSMVTAAKVSDPPARSAELE